MRSLVDSNNAMVSLCLYSLQVVIYTIYNKPQAALCALYRVSHSLPNPSFL